MGDNLNKDISKEIGTRLLSAGSSAVVAKSIVSPFDRVKLILQSQESNHLVRAGHVRPFNGILTTIGRLVHEQGFLALWRGNLASICRYFPQQALNFTLYNSYGKYFKSKIKENPARFLAGGLAGYTTSTIIFPITFCQTRISTDLGSYKGVHKQQFTGFRSCFVKIYSKEGIKGFYKGFISSTFGVALYRSLYFALFDTGKRIMTRITQRPDDKKLPVYLGYPIAQVSAISSGLLSYPIDTISRRLMMQAGLEDTQYHGFFHCTSQLYKQGGGVIFYRGALCNAFCSIGGALVLVLNDEILDRTNTNVTLTKIPSLVSASPTDNQD